MHGDLAVVVDVGHHLAQALGGLDIPAVEVAKAHSPLVEERAPVQAVTTPSAPDWRLFLRRAGIFAHLIDRKIDPAALIPPQVQVQIRHESTQDADGKHGRQASPISESGKLIKRSRPLRLHAASFR